MMPSKVRLIDRLRPYLHKVGIHDYWYPILSPDNRINIKNGMVQNEVGERYCRICEPDR